MRRLIGVRRHFGRRQILPLHWRSSIDTCPIELTILDEHVLRYKYCPGICIEGEFSISQDRDNGRSVMSRLRGIRTHQHFPGTCLPHQSLRSHRIDSCSKLFRSMDWLVTVNRSLQTVSMHRTRCTPAGRRIK